MIVLTVVSYNGAPSDGPAANFDELGGSIGRADSNQLVLPDPERSISRVHARVVFRSGVYAITDEGSNASTVNGQTVGRGREQPLAPGDELQVGGYLIKVSGGAGGAAKVSDDPFADLFGDAVGLAAAPVAAPSRPAPAASPRTSTPAPRVAPTPAPAAGGIPDDWDLFAPDHDVPAPPAQGRGAGQPADPFAAVDLSISTPAAEDSLDALFGLAGSPSSNPLASGPLSAPAAGPNTGARSDPLRALGAPAAPAPPATLGDFGSELNTPMSLPPAARPAPPPALPSGAIFSWDEPAPEGRVVTLPGVHRARDTPPRAPPAPVAAPAPPPPPARPSPAPPPPAPMPAPMPAAAASAAGGDALLQGLLAGLNSPALRIDALTPQTMQHIGALLREATGGAVGLLIARAALKREMRADMTMIVAQENNPLKFSPSVDAALQQLLGPPAPGFMAPVPAMRDAFDDLRAHQLGVMAGMRAALEGVLERFDPRQLEGKLTKKSTFSSLIPGARKAQLWQLFQDLFAQLSSEAQDDFEELFGRAFVKAYEAQLKRLQNDGDRR